MAGKPLYDVHELLSTYLDGQADDPAFVEQELASRPELRQELEEMRQVRGLLLQMPVIAPPRSFALDEISIRRRKKVNRMAPVTWALRSVAAVAVIMFMFVAAGDFRDSFNAQQNAGNTISQTLGNDNPGTQPVGPDGRVTTTQSQRTLEPQQYRGLEALFLGLIAISGGGLWYVSRRN